ncbi:hypothetical protein, partial [Bacillus pumilus]
APADKPEVAISDVVPWVYQAYNQRYPITNDIDEKVLDKYFELKSKQESNDTQAKNKNKIENAAETND